MGEGGVACVPSQHVVERFSISGGQSNGNGTNSNASNIELSANMNAQNSSKKKKKIKKVIRKKKGGNLGLKSSVNSKEQDLGSNNHSSSSNINSSSRVVVSDLNKDEVEEGELGTLPELIVDGRWRKGEEDVDTTAASGSWRKDELEKGEFVPDRWRPKDDYSYSRGRKYDSAKEKIWKGERDWTTPPPPPPPPPSGKYLSEKELSRSANQVNKRGGILGRGPKMSSKFVDEDGYEVNNGKNYARDYFSGNRLKRPCFDGDNKSEDYTSSKSRKLSANGARSMYSTDQAAQRAAYRNAPAASRQVSSDRYSSRHYDSSRMAHDKYNSSESRARHYDHRERSPGTGHHDRSRSPYDRSRHSPYDRSHQGDRSRSPYDRSRHFKRSPSYSEWSPSDQARYQRGGTPSFTPPDHGRPRELNRKGAAFQKKQSSGGRKGAEEKPKQKDPNGRDLRTAVKDSGDRIILEKCKNVVPDCGPTSQAPVTIAKEMIQENGTAQELVSMEEDMDICNTPPHEPVVDTTISGKWFYLNQLGDEQGPSRLCDLKKLMEEGFIVSDHLVKHLDSDRWVTVEKAVSPVANANIKSVVPDSSSALVSPPEASGNLLVDTDDVVDTSNQVGQGIPSPSSDLSSCSKRCLAAIEPAEDLNIDGRVDAFLDGHTLIPGKELDIVGEMLHMMSGDGEWERWRNIEGFTCPQVYLGENYTQISDKMVVSSESTLKEGLELSASGLTLTDEKGGSAFDYEDVVGFSGQWPCKGGDWKRTDETAQDRTSRKKLVLNGSYPLCQMPKSGFEDPRWQCKDKLYYPSQSKKLDLPPWACSLAEDWNDNSIVNRMAQSKLSIAREMRGIMLPVVRINACVVNDPEPVASDSRMKAKSKGKYKSSRNYSATGEPRRSSSEGLSRPKSMHDKDSRGFQTSNTTFSAPKDRVCTADELQLGLGEWYYVDGAGHERGPLSFSELQVLVDQGVIQKYSSAFRKVDKVWVPVTSASKTSETTKMSEISDSNKNSENSLLKHDDSDGVSSRFHTLHPQFIGYTRGKLHELVMKTYKSREFAAAINEVLDPWLNARQPKKEMEKQIYNSTILQKSDQLRDCKKLHAAGSDDEDEMEHAWTPLKDELPFDAMCCNAKFGGEKDVHPELGNGSWVQLDGRILARVFHFLRADVKTLVNVALTCKIWRSVLSCYKKASRQVDLSSIAPTCNDAMLWNIMESYNKENVCTLVLRGCSNITPHMLEDVLQSFLSMSSVDIRGCSQLEDLASKFTNIYWIKSRTVHSRRSMKDVTDKSSLASKMFSSLNAHADESSGLRHYLESSERRDSANQFRQSLYKRPKLYDTRQPSSILSRDAHLRRLAMRNSYKRMERLIASNLKDIMKENTFGIFVPKVAEIENRMRNGYYAGRGLSCVIKDIHRMCWDAMKSKNRGDARSKSKGDARNINQIITLFIRLAESLDGSADSSSERGRDGSPPGFSASARQKKKIMEKRYMNRGNGSTVVNDISECDDYASDREIKRHLSRLNKKPMDSGSETSDGSLTDSESTASDTESDLDLKSEIGGGGSRRDQYIPPDDGLDSLADEREWGARMTKSGLVPPVTRKYEVIDEYVIVAEEEEVKRKMRVSFPEDYDEKLNAQRNGTEESETQIPIQKEYKPRKQLGTEVIEQEVYGIDPYTHNLILDSMQGVSDWTRTAKHTFIENVLLRVLNKQVRSFTGSGITPMVYQLKPAFQEIRDSAEEARDEKTVRLCENVLKAIDSRPGDNYVAYRKGLGVVCNKEGGFNEDDFVVEFLGEVYPAWKWYEKQDGIRSLQKNSKDPAPEFYNILLDRPKGDADGFDLLVVDAMHKANYASRICHSCKPNCEAKVTAVNGQYLIGIYTVRPIEYGEEVTFDYNSVTESKQEAEASVCLCGNEVCRGSYLNLLGEEGLEKVRIESHGVLDRLQLLLEACELNSVSEEDHIDLLKVGLGRCLLDGLPDWLIAYSARLVRFINFERVELSKKILRHNLDEKKKFYGSEISEDHEKREAEVQANGVFDRRLQDLAITLNKVRYVTKCVFGNPKTAPPPLQRLSARERVSYLWTGEESLVKELLECIAPHVDDITLKELKAKIHAHDPSNSDDIELGLKKSLIWLRDEVRDLSCSSKCRHDAAADLIHIYAHTKCFIKMREYKTVTSPPIYISPLDLCQKSGDSLGTQGHEYVKTYGENYCLGQLIYWYNHDKPDPDCSLARGSRGCLSLPEIGSFYAKVQKPSRQRVYGTRTVKLMLSRMKKQPQKPWPKDRIWSFTDTPKVVGSPMLDAVLSKASLDKEMVHWLKNRVSIFQAIGDR